MRAFLTAPTRVGTWGKVEGWTLRIGRWHLFIGKFVDQVCKGD